MEKFKDVLAWIIIAIMLIIILVAMIIAVIFLAKELISAGLGLLVWLVAVVLGILAISRIVGWAIDRVI